MPSQSLLAGKVTRCSAPPWRDGGMEGVAGGPSSPLSTPQRWRTSVPAQWLVTHEAELHPSPETPQSCHLLCPAFPLGSEAPQRATLLFSGHSLSQQRQSCRLRTHHLSLWTFTLKGVPGSLWVEFPLCIMFILLTPTPAPRYRSSIAETIHWSPPWFPDYL